MLDGQRPAPPGQCRCRCRRCAARRGPDAARAPEPPAGGALRGVWAQIGLRGPMWSLAHAVVRLSTDQTLENATGVGAPPARWARQEHAIDVLHKVVYALATGLLADRLVTEQQRPLPGRTSH